MTELEKLLAAARSGRLNRTEQREISETLRKGLSAQQAAMLNDLLRDPDALNALMTSPQVKKLLEETK